MCPADSRQLDDRSGLGSGTAKLVVAAVLTRELPQADTDPVVDLAGYAPSR
ncbi:MAG TPA: hypothetical protein VF838_03405 [Trebonia sp.]